MNVTYFPYSNLLPQLPMAAATNPTSRYVETYKDKTAEWVKARLEHLQDLENRSRTGSIPRRQEIRLLRVEYRNRTTAAEAAGESIEPIKNKIPLR